MFIKLSFLVYFVIHRLSLVICDYHNTTFGCAIPNNVYNITLDQLSRYGGGFIKSFVNFPPGQDTDLKCLTLHLDKFDGEFLHILYRWEKITTSQLLEQEFLVKELRPGVYEAHSASLNSTDVVIKYVLAHHPYWTVFTECLYKNGTFDAQSSFLLSKTWILNPLEQLDIYRDSAKINVYRSMEVGQFFCQNNDFPEPTRGYY